MISTSNLKFDSARLWVIQFPEAVKNGILEISKIMRTVAKYIKTETFLKNGITQDYANLFFLLCEWVRAGRPLEIPEIVKYKIKFYEQLRWDFYDAEDEENDFRLPRVRFDWCAQIPGPIESRVFSDPNHLPTEFYENGGYVYHLSEATSELLEYMDKQNKI